MREDAPYFHTLYQVISTKWRSCRDHRICDFTSPDVMRLGTGVQDKSLTTDFDYLPGLRRLAICAQRSVRLMEIRANETSQVRSI